eukprot:768029-Hanusia_phi.AAC.2
MLKIEDLLEALWKGAGSDLKDFPPVLVIIDACRTPVQGLETNEPDKSNATRRIRLSLCLSCSRSQEAPDESDFLKDLLDDELGMFAQNRRLRDAMDHAVRQSFTREEHAIDLNTALIPHGFCIRVDQTVAADIQHIQQGARQLILASNSLDRDGSATLSSSPDQEMVAAHSYAPAQTVDGMFQRNLLDLVQESLDSILREISQWKICSTFLLVFLRYTRTMYDSKATQIYFQGVSKKNIGPELIRVVGDAMVQSKICSEELEQWLKTNFTGIIVERNMMALAAIYFTVQKETITSLASRPEVAINEIKSWERGARFLDFFHRSIGLEEALDIAEEYLRTQFNASLQPIPLLAVHVLSRVVETGSCVAFLKMTRLSAACLSVVLARRVRETLRGDREEDVFRTWVSSSGWVYGSHEHGELDERLKEEQVDQLRSALEAVGRDETDFLRWEELEQAGALSVLRRQQEESVIGRCFTADRSMPAESLLYTAVRNEKVNVKVSMKRKKVWNSEVKQTSKREKLQTLTVKQEMTQELPGETMKLVCEESEPEKEYKEVGMTKQEASEVEQAGSTASLGAGRKCSRDNQEATVSFCSSDSLKPGRFYDLATESAALGLVEKSPGRYVLRQSASQGFVARALTTGQILWESTGPVSVWG